MQRVRPRVTVAEFLALPEEKPYLELIDGEVVPKAMGGLSQSRVITEVLLQTVAYERTANHVSVDLYVRHLDRGHNWVFLPAISATLRLRRPMAPADTPDPVEIMPDLAIEVLSPDDKPGRISQRIAYYLRAGVRLLWIIDPETELVTVWEAGALPRIVEAPEALDGSPVLPGFALDLAALFGRLHQHRP